MAWRSAGARCRQRRPWNVPKPGSTQLARHHETVPHQSNQPTQRLTWRWVFPRLEGMHRVRLTRDSRVHDLLEGLGPVQVNILRLFGEEVGHLYQISPSEGLLNVGSNVNFFSFKLTHYQTLSSLDRSGIVWWVSGVLLVCLTGI